MADASPISPRASAAWGAIHHLSLASTRRRAGTAPSSVRFDAQNERTAKSHGKPESQDTTLLQHDIVVISRDSAGQTGTSVQWPDFAWQPAT
jgi:hypothetical protein